MGAREELAAVDSLCEVMHDAYEDAAVREGWETQERSRKPWSDVPEANKATMRAAVSALLASPALARLLDEARREALRSAAEEGPATTATDQLWRMWLRDRADAIATMEEAP